MAFHRFRDLIPHSPSNFLASRAPPAVSLYRLLCSAATAVSQQPPSSSSFAAEDFLVSRCGLTRAQAAKASKSMPRLSSTARPEAVLALLGGTLGLPAAAVASLIARNPRILCSDAERAVAPRVAELSGLGLSRGQVARLVALFPNFHRSRLLHRKVEFWVQELGSFDNLLQALKVNHSLLTYDIDKVAAPNVAFLRQCGLNPSEMVSANNYHYARFFTCNPARLREAGQRAEELGIKPGEKMFRRAFVVMAWVTKEAAHRRTQLLQKFGFSQDQAMEMQRKVPDLLGGSDKKVQDNLDFLIKEAGLDLSYIARRPALLFYSIKRRLVPRHCLLKVLREKGLMATEWDYYSIAVMSEKRFLQKFVLPYQDAVPGLTDAYATKCSGKAAE